MKSRLPLLISGALLLLQITAVTIISVQNNGGNFIYVLDDSYIHLAIAKNFSQLGIWGTTSDGFSASTSSLLWTVILSAIFTFTGVSEGLPFILNIIISLLVLYELNRFLSGFIINRYLLTFALTGIPFISLFPFLVLTGMEHILHVYLCILMINALLDYYNNKKPFVRLIIIASLLSSVRYEALFFVFIISLFILLNKDVKTAMGIWLAALFPVVIFGIYSISQGGYFLPNTILLKGNQSSFSVEALFFFFFKPVGALFKYYQHQLFILILVLVIVVKEKGRDPFTKNFPWIFLITFALHSLFARIPGAFDFNAMIRYDAYLVFIGVTFIAGAYGGRLWSMIVDIQKKAEKSNFTVKGAIILLLIITSFPLLFRSLKTTSNTPRASQNIYSQQIQMGEFFSFFYPDVHIAVNDIGAVSYFKGRGVIDLIGLSDNEIAGARLKQNFNSQFIIDYLNYKETEVLAIYDSWFKNMTGFREKLFKAGEWTIRNNEICGDSVVSFYGLNPASADQLKTNLKRYESSLPADVKVKYY